MEKTVSKQEMSTVFVTLAFIIVGGPDGSCSYEEPIHFFGL